MGGKVESDKLEGWAHAVARLFELREAGRAAQVAEMIDDLSCWHLGELEGTQVIRVHNEQLPHSRLSVTRAAGGLKVPLHTHDGREELVVLEGGVTEGNGRRVGPGETIVSAAGEEHRLDVDPEGCIAAMRVDPLTSNEG